MLVNAATDKTCTVCFRPAFGNNYGSFSCDACKMFFRRTLALDLQYVCSRENRCFDSLTKDSKTPRCKACRFQKCLKTGMFIKPSTLFKVGARQEDDMETLIGRLLYLDSRRLNVLMSKFTFENPGLEEIVNRKQMKLISQSSSYQMSDEDWRFIGMYTTIEFLLNQDFMGALEVSDRLILLKQFSARATLLFSSLRAVRGKHDRLVTPGGQEIVPDVLSTLFNVSLNYLCRIRSLLVNKLIEINITNEEFLLITVILFCDPAIPNLSENASTLLTSRRQCLTSALFEYCQLTSQQTAPSRFTELLSLCHVVNRNIEDIQNLAMFVKMKLKTAECKQLFNDII